MTEQEAIQAVRTTHQHLQAADRRYAQAYNLLQRTLAHRRIITAQRAYYVALRNLERIYYPEPRTHALRTLQARRIRERAKLNAARQPNDAHWQEIAKHQKYRALTIHSQTTSRAMVEREELQATKPKRVRTTNLPPRRRIHPITRMLHVCTCTPPCGA